MIACLVGVYFCCFESSSQQHLVDRCKIGMHDCFEMKEVQLMYIRMCLRITHSV